MLDIKIPDVKTPDIKIPDMKAGGLGSSTALKVPDFSSSKIGEGQGLSPLSKSGDRFHPSQLLSKFVGDGGNPGLERQIFDADGSPPVPDLDLPGNNEPLGNAEEPADPAQETPGADISNEPLQAQSEDPSKPGYVPPDSLVGTKGGQCVGFVQKQLGVWFPVETAGQMLDEDKHPGFDRVDDPQPGDVFVRKGSSANPAGHTGFVKSADDEYVYVIDSNSNWDETVQVHKYRRDQIDGYLRKQPAE